MHSIWRARVALASSLRIVSRRYATPIQLPSYEEVDHETEEASYLHRIARRHAVADWLSITGMKRVESSGEKVRIFFRAWNVFEGFFFPIGLFGQIGLFAFD